MNAKSRGEKGERIVIGALAKFEIDVALPMTDNLPFDFIVIYEGTLFKVQVKSSSMSICTGSIKFDITSNNWQNKIKRKYDESDCDVMMLCDYDSVYILNAFDFTGKTAFTIRREEAKNGQTKGMNFHDDYVLSHKRIKKVFGGVAQRIRATGS